MSQSQNPNQFPKAKDILDKELRLSGWHSLTNPTDIFDTLEICVNNTYKHIRSACWGDNVRTMACDALFKEAQAGIRAARKGIESVSFSAVNNTEKAPAKSKTDWFQPVLLVISAILVLWCCIRSRKLLSIAIGVFAVIVIISALMREIQRFIQSGGPMKIVRFLASMFRLEKLLARAENALSKMAEADPKPEAAPMRTKMDIMHLEKECMKQMDIIDSNLVLFNDPVVVSSDEAALSSLVRILIQEKYTGSDSLPDSVKTVLAQHLQAHGLKVVEYSAESAHLFQTQPMDETFTIFPAILDKDGSVIEYGLAGVCEE